MCEPGGGASRCYYRFGLAIGPRAAPAPHHAPPRVERRPVWRRRAPAASLVAAASEPARSERESRPRRRPEPRRMVAGVLRGDTMLPAGADGRPNVGCTGCRSLQPASCDRELLLLLLLLLLPDPQDCSKSQCACSKPPGACGLAQAVAARRPPAAAGSGLPTPASCGGGQSGGRPLHTQTQLCWDVRVACSEQAAGHRVSPERRRNAADAAGRRASRRRWRGRLRNGSARRTTCHTHSGARLGAAAGLAGERLLAAGLHAALQELGTRGARGGAVG